MTVTYANCSPTAHEYPYPFETPGWNVIDQNYWCKMWGFGYRGVKEPFLCIIQNNRCSTFEQEYQEYKAAQAQGTT